MKILKYFLISIFLLVFIFIIYAVTSDDYCGTDEECATRQIEERNN